MKNELAEYFQQKGIDAKVVSSDGTYPLRRYHLTLGAKTEVAHILKLSKEIGLSLKALDEPIIVPEYKSGMIRIEAMLSDHPTVDFHTLLDKADLSKFELPILLGTQNVSEPFFGDLQKMPHLLIGGTTGSGKSMLLHSAINTLMPKAKSKNINFLLLDPKQVEFMAYGKSPRAEIISSPEECLEVIEQAILKVNSTFGILKKAKCRDAQEYRFKKGVQKLPYTIIVIDELADLVQSCGKKFLIRLTQLTQKCRAAGFHIIAATQHPSAKVVPGELKANFPFRIGCKVSSIAHSRVLFDTSGAEKLLGKGDALINGGSFNMQRFKGALLNFEEVAKRQKHLNRSFLRKWFEGDWNAIFN